MLATHWRSAGGAGPGGGDGGGGGATDGLVGTGRQASRRYYCCCHAGDWLLPRLLWGRERRDWEGGGGHLEGKKLSKFDYIKS